MLDFNRHEPSFFLGTIFPGTDTYVVKLRVMIHNPPKSELECEIFFLTYGNSFRHALCELFQEIHFHQFHLTTVERYLPNNPPS